MISVSQAKKQSRELIDSGDPHRAIMVMTTPFKLAVLSLHLAHYTDMMAGVAEVDETINMLGEIRDDLQKVVMQILQQEFPPS